jgi:hypothetical protein
MQIPTMKVLKDLNKVRKTLGGKEKMGIIYLREGGFRRSDCDHVPKAKAT